MSFLPQPNLPQPHLPQFKSKSSITGSLQLFYKSDGAEAKIPGTHLPQPARPSSSPSPPVACPSSFRSFPQSTVESQQRRWTREKWSCYKFYQFWVLIMDSSDMMFSRSCRKKVSSRKYWKVFEAKVFKYRSLLWSANITACTLVHEQNHTRKELTGKAKERGDKSIAIEMETHTLEWEGNCSNIEDERADPLCRWLESITQPNSWFFPHPGTTYWNH